jgi:hypothetical protein
MMMTIAWSLNAFCALFAARGFWLGRNIISRGVSSKKIWVFSMNIVYTYAFNLLFTLAMGIWFLKDHNWLSGLLAVGYFSFPFIVGRLADTYDSKRWALPMMSLANLSCAVISVYLGFSG